MTFTYRGTDNLSGKVYRIKARNQNQACIAMINFMRKVHPEPQPDADGVYRTGLHSYSIERVH